MRGESSLIIRQCPALGASLLSSVGIPVFRLFGSRVVVISWSQAVRRRLGVVITAVLGSHPAIRLSGVRCFVTPLSEHRCLGHQVSIRDSRESACRRCYPVSQTAAPGVIGSRCCRESPLLLSLRALCCVMLECRCSSCIGPQAGRSLLYTSDGAGLPPVCRDTSLAR
jgi:hypothetical protein